MAIEAYIRQQISINISFDYDLLLIWQKHGTMLLKEHGLSITHVYRLSQGFEMT